MAATQGGGKSWQMLELVRRGVGRAEAIVRNPKELLGLLSLAERQLARIEAGPLTPLKKDLQTLLRMLEAYGEGRYQSVSKKHLALAGLGLVYLVSPLDLLPDFIPGGFADDAAVIGFVVRTVRTELMNFEAWERRQGSQDGRR